MVDHVVGQIWARRTRAGRPDWAGAMGSSDIWRGLMKPMALRRAGVPSPTQRKQGHDRPGGGRLRPDERFDYDDGETVRTWFDGDGWKLVSTLCGRAREVADMTLAALECTEALVNRREIRAWALRTVGRAHWDGIDVPTLDDLAARMDEFREQEIAEGPLRRMRMDEEAFLEAVTGEWDVVWPPDRPAPPRAPSELGLGRDVRPPLAGRSGNWHLGTDRSVFSRYRGYFDASTRVKPPSDPHPTPDQHVTRRFRGRQPVDIALTEVHRAAAPLGLAHAGHRSALVCTARGLQGRAGSAGGWLDLPGWAARGGELPLEPDDELTDAVRTHTVDWTANARLAGELDVGDGLPEKVLHRLWQRLHGREVEWEVPLSRAGFDVDLRRMFGSHLHERNDPPPEPPPDSVPGPSLLEDERVQATFDHVQAHPDGTTVVLMAYHGDDGWTPLYEAILGSHHDLLPPAEFRAEVLRHASEGGESR